MTSIKNYSTNVEAVLKATRNGLSLDELMKKICIECTNRNRLLLISTLKWNNNIERTYVKYGKQLVTIFYLTPSNDSKYVDVNTDT